MYVVSSFDTGCDSSSTIGNQSNMIVTSIYRSNNKPLLCLLSNKYRTILEKNKCDKCNLTIHPNFIGNHKCDHQNCPVCKSPISPSQYWFHIRTHPGHENDSPPPPKERTFENRGNTNRSGYGNYQRT